MKIEAIPEILKQKKQWCYWKGIDGKKIPCNEYGKPIDITNQENLLSFEVIQNDIHNGKYDGIGFVLTEADGIVAIDLDNCLDGEISEYAQYIVEYMQSYTEISPSGKGLHILLITKDKSQYQNIKKNGIEIYFWKRFITVTAKTYQNYNTIHDRTEQLRHLISATTTHVLPQQICPQISPEDMQIIRQSMHENPKMKDIWEGKWNMYYASHSEADLALCAYLARIFRGNVNKIDAAFRASMLYRYKWDEKRGNVTYGELTIQKAIQNMHNIQSIQSIQNNIENDSNKDEIAKLAEHIHITCKIDLFSLPKEREWIIYPFIPRDCITLLAGYGGTGKTMISLYMILCALLGKPIHKQCQTKKIESAVIVSAEDDIHEIHSRLFRISRYMIDTKKCTIEEIQEVQKKIIIITNDFQGYDFLIKSNRYDVEASSLYHAIKRIVTRDTIVYIDALTSCISIEFNNAMQVQKALQILHNLGCTVFMSHHLNKAFETDIEKMQNYILGSSSITNRARQAIILYRNVMTIAKSNYTRKKAIQISYDPQYNIMLPTQQDIIDFQDFSALFEAKTMKRRREYTYDPF